MDNASLGCFCSILRFADHSAPHSTITVTSAQSVLSTLALSGHFLHARWSVMK